ncbi:hypothetical protein FN846DRAFT_901281 [Sphaerosporella brunnea]|uniref:60S ribosome subunit biogenesis protein NIP7 pre-PUA domain-containing protein n=1 Tax=Sphaerosporella brunnea TaxID=1250544 RepID=A0A5J5EFF9_9PEZI|nr:hypothetical protein FN846DRAFT_901281 [Sphaerosporella brunnea]
MRPLTDQETSRLFKKLASYRDRVYYVRESIAKLATSASRDKLLSVGTCLGKFTTLDHIAPHAYNGEMLYLMSEDTPEHQGVLVFWQTFARVTTPEVRRSDPTAIMVFRQADAREYLREEVASFLCVTNAPSMNIMISSPMEKSSFGSL